MHNKEIRTRLKSKIFANTLIILVFLGIIFNSTCYATNSPNELRDTLIVLTAGALTYGPIIYDMYDTSKDGSDRRQVIKVIKSDNKIITSYGGDPKNTNLVAAGLISSGLIWTCFARENKSIMSGIMGSWCLGHGIDMYQKGHAYDGVSAYDLSFKIGAGMIAFNLLC